MTIKMGDAVAIKAMFIAWVVWLAMYIKLLKAVTPNRADTDKYGRCFFTSFQSLIVPGSANGAKAIVAIVHRQNARLIGGISWLNALATMKLPAQMAVAATARQ